MFEKLRKRNLQKKYNLLVKRMADDHDAFITAVNANEDIPDNEKDDLNNFYWSNIDFLLRFQLLENRCSAMDFDIGLTFGSLIALGILLLMG